MNLRPIRSPGRMISLVPLIDVFMILLVFFLVTSTYLDLDAIPATASDQGTAAEGAQHPGTLLLRLRSDGQIVLRGKQFAAPALAAPLAEWRSVRPNGVVVVIPSGAASMQDLAALMDALRIAEVGRLRLLRLRAPA